MSSPICEIFWDGYAISSDVFVSYFNRYTVNVHYKILSQELKTWNFSRLQTFVDSLIAIGRPARQSLLFCLEDTDNILLMSENPTAVAFIERVFEFYPHIPYFIADFYESIHFKRLIQLDREEVWKRLRTMRDAVAQYGKSIGDELAAREIVRAWRIELDKLGVL